MAQYTFTSGGRQYIATPTTQTTPDQMKQVASNPAFTPIAPTPISTAGQQVYKSPTGAYSTDPSVLGPSYVPVTINSELLAPKAEVQLPQKPQTPDYTGTVTGGNTGLATLLSGFTMDSGGRFVQVPQQPTELGTSAENLRALIGITPKKESVTTSPEYQMQKNVVEQRQSEVNNLVAQLNTVTAKMQADQLRVIGQGRGIPETVIGGQQAQIAREAAIQALPLQAQISAAQGNLELAQQRLDEVYRIKKEETDATYDYQLRVFDAISNFVSKSEQRQLDARKEGLSTNKSLFENFASTVDSYGKLAVENNQADVAAGMSRLVSGLNINSPTFASDLARAQDSFANYQSKLKIIQPTTTSLLSTGVLSEITGKPLTEGERMAQGYAKRAADSSSVIDKLGSQFTAFGAYVGEYAPNFLKSAERQQFEQAQRDFINAVLRKESGAAIAESEFENARKQYFPQVGDKPEVVEQKRNNRQNKINSLLLEGGVTSQPQDIQVNYVTKEDGSVWRPNPDGSFTRIK